MARPSKEDEQKVEKELAKIRKRFYDQYMANYRLQYKSALKTRAVDLTEMTSWKPKETDPLGMYKSNTDHWSKMRVQADNDVARRHLRGQGSEEASPSGPTGQSTCQPFVWSADKAKCLEDKRYPDMILECLMPDLPGDLTRPTNKNYNKVKLSLPENEFNRQTLHPNFQYWYQDVQEQKRYKSRKTAPLRVALCSDRG